MFADLFLPGGQYHNTLFADSRSRPRPASMRTGIESSCRKTSTSTYSVLSKTPDAGIAHWHVTYQVASEELFQVWPRPDRNEPGISRKPGDPLPRMVLDGVLQAEFQDGQCRTCRLWWHALPQPAAESAA